jgi:phenylalanyl-tRNA synthetase beta chain
VVELINPVSSQERFLRSNLLPGLLRRVEYNLARGIRDVRLFELGGVFHAGEPEGLPAEETRLSVAFTGGRGPLHWGSEGQDTDLWEVKGILSRLIDGARYRGAALAEGAPAGTPVVKGEGFTVVSKEGATLGFGGRVEPSRIDAPAWAGPVWCIELTLDAEPGPRPVPVVGPPPAYPGVDRDLALLLPKGLPARQVEDVVRGAAGPLLIDVEVFDLYEGQGIPDDHRSVAFRLSFQSEERTLTDEDVDRSVAAVTARLREELGVETRG